MTHDNRKLPPIEGSGSQLRAPVSKSDSAYKLRMELLQLATSRLTEEYNSKVVQAVESARTYQTKPEFTGIVFPTVEQILEEARKLKVFFR